VDPIIFRKPLRTQQYDSTQLNSPDFVGSFEHKDFVYFFFRERAVEHTNCGKTVFSRVARVCKNDRGGPNKSKYSWTSFLKARLNCSVPGNFPFYFNEIQAVSQLVLGRYGVGAVENNVNIGDEIDKDAILYATFSTAPNAIGMSTVFRLTIDHVEPKNLNFLPASTRSVPPGIHFALMLLLLLLVLLLLLLLLGRPLIKHGTISADS
jgi:semaphorin 6